ncbi:MAG: prolipoprotein diacylglyceryl transferase [Lachnospiraceae bacterium]|nr:prolipoprotein diacylglyceryl transferase [Lachnospiraceae bacterium]
MMGVKDIAFPNLGIYLENVPKSISVFGFEIAFYGIIIFLGVLAGILVAARIAKITGQNPDTIWDMATYCVIFSIIGGRLYYVIFSWEYYKDNFWQVFNLRAGGMAIYGAVIAGFLTVFIYAKIKKLNALLLLDTAMPSLILGQAIGRWGNFFNREVFGEYYNGLLSMQLPIAAVRAKDISETIRVNIPEGANYINVHPTFLYESLWNLLVFAVLLLYRKYKKFDGELGLLYLAGYGLGRFIIEGIRTDTLFIPGTTVPVSQVLALVMLVAAVAIDVVVRVRLRKAKKA